MTHLALAFVLAIAIPAMPKDHILDDASLLSDDQRQSLAELLAQDKPGQELAVATVTRLEADETPKDIAQQLQTAWGVNHLLLVVLEPHRIWFATRLSTSTCQDITARMSVGMREHPGESVILGAKLLREAADSQQQVELFMLALGVVVLIFLVWAIWTQKPRYLGSYGGGGGDSGGFSCGGGSSCGGGGGGDSGGGGSW